MKSKLLGSILLLHITLLQGQEVFTDEFTSNTTGLLTINNALYVGTLENSSEQKGITKINFDNPNTLINVATYPEQGGGVWKFVYSPSDNSIYSGDLGSLIVRTDLDQDLPITSEIISTSSNLVTQGFVVFNGVLYETLSNQIISYEIGDIENTESVFFTNDNSSEVFNPFIFQGEFYFFEDASSGQIPLYKVDIDNPGAGKTLVLFLGDLEGRVQSTYVSGTTLYAGIEDVNATDKIFKIDLSNLSMDLEVIIDDFDGAPLSITSYQDKLYISNGAGTIFSFQDDSLNVSENKLNSEISVFPNPSNEILYLSHRAAGESVEYVISDILGRKNQSGIYNDGIDISLLKRGIYFITIMTDWTKTTKKIIKN